ncbi:Lacal_2735 family protein [uncultured Polaribacter sp.]|uniref:Lacal_2735 family protein n=1 Tax=uncultured Polaribacter sp. TaxID=174711 RepID=UPI00262F6F10|nr:Lacal_2735 family protein [uncultured Polaribacter sp.]
MTHKKQLVKYKNHLLKRYLKLLEKAYNYNFIDEAKSDLAAFKAMKIFEKINQVSYLEREVIQ